MKKEVFIAIIIGFSIGLVITLTAHYARRSNINQTGTEPNQQAIPDPSQEGFHQLELIPTDSTIISTLDVHIINGTTTPGSFVSILFKDQSETIIADSAGSFSTKIQLNEGTNTIQITAFHPDGSPAEKVLDVIYLPPEEPEENNEETEEES